MSQKKSKVRKPFYFVSKDSKVRKMSTNVCTNCGEPKKDKNRRYSYFWMGWGRWADWQVIHIQHILLDSLSANLEHADEDAWCNSAIAGNILL